MSDPDVGIIIDADGCALWYDPSSEKQLLCIPLKSLEAVGYRECEKCAELRQARAEIEAFKKDRDTPTKLSFGAKRRKLERLVGASGGTHDRPRTRDCPQGCGGPVQPD